MGWGEPAALNDVVSLRLCHPQHQQRRSRQRLLHPLHRWWRDLQRAIQVEHQYRPTKAQWQPNLSVSEAGTLFAMWYDETPRTSASCQPSSPTTLCYQMFSRKSTDNGVTWGADETFSDVVSPLPLQADPGSYRLYVGDYDYGSALVTKHFTSWADGRVAINGASQQDAFTDRELGGPHLRPVHLRRRLRQLVRHPQLQQRQRLAR